MAVHYVLEGKSSEFRNVSKLRKGQRSIYFAANIFSTVMDSMEQSYHNCGPKSNSFK